MTNRDPMINAEGTPEMPTGMEPQLPRSLNQTIALYGDSWTNAVTDPAEIANALRHPVGRQVLTDCDRLIADLIAGRVEIARWYSVSCADEAAVSREYRVPPHCQNSQINTQRRCIEEAMRRMTGRAVSSTFNWSLNGAAPDAKTLPELFAAVRIIEPREQESSGECWECGGPVSRGICTRCGERQSDNPLE